MITNTNAPIPSIQGMLLLSPPTTAPVIPPKPLGWLGCSTACVGTLGTSSANTYAMNSPSTSSSSSVVVLNPWFVVFELEDPLLELVGA